MANNCLLDTNIVSRSAEPGHPMYPDATNAVARLKHQGFGLCLAPQTLYEFWVVCTRPTNVNGLGKTPAEAAAELAKLKSLFTVLPDTPAVLGEWESLVTTHQVVGKNAHDARLVASMRVNGVSHLLTFNEQDFRRYPGITVLTPQGVLASAGVP